MRLRVATNRMMFEETCNMGLSFTFFVPLHKEVVNLIKDKYYIVIILFYYVNQQRKLKKINVVMLDISVYLTDHIVQPVDFVLENFLQMQQIPWFYIIAV